MNLWGPWWVWKLWMEYDYSSCRVPWCILSTPTDSCWSQLPLVFSACCYSSNQQLSQNQPDRQEVGFRCPFRLTLIGACKWRAILTRYRWQTLSEWSWCCAHILWSAERRLQRMLPSPRARRLEFCCFYLPIFVLISCCWADQYIFHRKSRRSSCKTGRSFVGHAWKCR